MSELRERLAALELKDQFNLSQLLCNDDLQLITELFQAEVNEKLAGLRAAYEKALWNVRREIPTSEPTFSACLKAIRQPPNEQADAGVQAIELCKEIALARHIKGGALDGCMCDPCVAVRSLLPQIKETHLETAKQFLRDRPRVVLENPEAAEMQPYVTKEALAELLRAIERRVLEKADAAVDAIPNINLHAKGEAKKAILALKGTATQPSDSSDQTPATPA